MSQSDIDITATQVSKNFYQYLNDFIEKGQQVLFPGNRANQGDLDFLNVMLAKYGVYLHFSHDKNGKEVIKFDIDKTSRGYGDFLYRRASKNIEQTLNDFLNKGVVRGFPVSRMDTEMWNDLAADLFERGAVLHLEQINGNDYFVLRTKEWVAQNGTEKEKQNLQMFDEIKKHYPNVPDGNIYKILLLNNGNFLSENKIYVLLRHNRPGQTFETDESLQDFKECIRYQKNFDRPITGHGVYGQEHDGWFWRGYVGGNSHAPVSGRDLWHISINAKLCPDLLYVLDDILEEDCGYLIQQYKFTDHYGAVKTRFDTISMYTYARDPELEAKIARAVQPFVRSNDGLMGDIIERGVSIIRDTSSTGKSVGQVAADQILQYITDVRLDRITAKAKDAQSLTERASKSFQIYLDDFMENGNNVALPKDRLLPQEWQELNKQLKSLGVGMKEGSGQYIDRMIFYKLPTNDQQSNFAMPMGARGR